MRKFGLRGVALGYLGIVLLGPLAMIFWKTFEHGFGTFWDSLTSPETAGAFKNTLLITAIAVPLNTLFGIVVALAIVRRRFPGKGVVNAFIDLPLAVSPVVVGVSLFLLYGRGGWLYGFFERHGVPIPSICTTTNPSSASAWVSPRAGENVRPPTLPVCGPG